MQVKAIAIALPIFVVRFVPGRDTKEAHGAFAGVGSKDERTGNRRLSKAREQWFAVRQGVFAYVIDPSALLAQ